VGVGIESPKLRDFGREFLSSDGGDMDFRSVGESAGGDCIADPRGTANDEGATVQEEVWVGHCEVDGMEYATDVAVLILRWWSMIQRPVSDYYAQNLQS
jgi:hypothetical protein